MPLAKNVSDQFAFADQVGYVDSRRMVKVLRNTHRHAPIGEGELAIKCGERVYMPAWKELIDRMVKWDLIKLEPTGTGRSNLISLGKAGEAWIEADNKEA
jgi:hypothetical protein